MNREQKMRVAMALFNSGVRLTPEQYKQFKLFAEELDLTVKDVTDWNAIEQELNQSK